MTSTWLFLYCLLGLALAMCVAGLGSYFLEFRHAPRDPFDEIAGDLGDTAESGRNIIRAHAAAERLRARRIQSRHHEGDHR